MNELEIPITKKHPTEEGDYFYFNTETGDIRLVKVIEHTPLQYAGEKCRDKYNPNNRKYFAVPEFKYRNVKGLVGTWSDKLVYSVPKIKLF